ncbi:MAG: Ig-like domain-containing protein [Anaerolineales bacterium]
MKNIRTAFAFALLASLLAVFSAHAQDTTLTISFSRDFGYSSGGGDIQGLFSIRASGPADLVKVVFYIDDQILAEVDKAPFSFQFTTDNYALGQHQLYAIGTTSGGQTLKSRVFTENFVSAEAGTKAAMNIVIPILVIVFGAILAATVGPLLLTGRKTVNLPAGATRSYPLGGAICPKCQRPFGVHIYGLNLMGSKYDRCPYCGKWSLVSYASRDKLRAAEQAELLNVVTDGSGQVPGLSEEEKLKKELDESKYRDV